MISEGKDGGVPVGWFAVEHAAEILIGSTGTAMSPATFQFRATRDVLALTLLLAGITGPADGLSRPQLGLVRDLLADDQQWQAWCRTGLLSASPVMGHADLRL